MVNGCAGGQGRDDTETASAGTVIAVLLMFCIGYYLGTFIGSMSASWSHLGVAAASLLAGAVGAWCWRGMIDRCRESSAERMEQW